VNYFVNTSKFHTIEAYTSHKYPWLLTHAIVGLFHWLIAWLIGVQTAMLYRATGA